MIAAAHSVPAPGHCGTSSTRVQRLAQSETASYWLNHNSKVAEFATRAHDLRNQRERLSPP